MNPKNTIVRASQLASSLRSITALVALPFSIYAVPYNWDGGGANANWGTVANWVGDPTPVFDNTADITFYATGTTTQLTNAINGDRTIRSLAFSADADSNVLIRTRNAIGGAQVGRALTFDTDAIGGNATLTVDAGATGSHSIAGGSVTAINLGGSIVLTDSLNVIHNGNGTLTLGQNNDGSFAGSETIITGAGAIIKSGTGVLALAGPNTFAGGVNLSGGRIQVTNSNALGTGAITLAGTGSELRLSTTGVSTPAANSLTVSDSGDLKTLSGLVSGGSTTFGGAVVIEETTAANFEISSGANHTFTVTGNITGATAAGVKKSSAGIAILSGNNTYSGDTLVSNGTLRAGSATAIPSGTGKGNVEISSGGTFSGILDLNGYNVSINGLVGGTSTFSGQLVNNVSGNATLTLGGGDATSTYSGVIKDNSGTGGTIAIIKNGAGAQTLGGINTYSGGSTILGGRLDLRSGQAAGSGAITLAGTGAELQVGPGLTVANNVVVSDTGDLKAIRFFDSGGLIPGTYSGNITIAETTEGNFSVNVGANATFTISGNISGTGAAGLKKGVGGNLILTGTNNTYTGPTTVGAGMLTLTNPSLDDLSTVNLITGATLNLAHSSTDTVSKLFIDGIQSSAGIYKAVGAAGVGTELSFLVGTGKLQVTSGGGATFATWIAGYTFGVGADVTASGDPDSDGIVNLIEHVLGTAPNVSSTGISLISASNTSLTFSHTLNPAVVAGVTYGYQWSTDLAEWNTSGVANLGGVVVTMTPSAPVADVVTVTANVTTGSTTRLFTRLVATLAP